jgi:hypothetical protein
MTSISDEAINKATGRDRAGWRAWLDAEGAARMEHRAIASMLAAHGIDHWWAQMVTVEYERMIGRRAVGQRCDGAFGASASRTLQGDMDSALTRWQASMAGRVLFDGVAADEAPRVTSTERWRYWRLALEDGTQIVAMVCAKGPDKVTLTINHNKLPDVDAVARWKAYWKAELAGL